jgi:tetratricopeptide (TPR) repeat protein
VSRLGLPADAADANVLRERNHQRFLSGETKPPEVAERVLGAVASVLARHGYIETAGWPMDLGFPTPEMLLFWALQDLRRRWDRACIRVRGGTLRGAEFGPVLRTAAHLFVIDLAVRGGAWLVLIDHPGVPRDKPPGTPTTKAVMNFVIEKSGRTVPDLAKRLGIERTAIDDWRKGARPSDVNLGIVSKLLAEGEPEWAELVWWRLLRRNLAIAEILKALGTTPWFKGQVGDLWQAFWAIASGVAWRLRSQEEALGEDAWPRILTGLVMWGSAYPASIPLLHDLRAEAPNAWQSDLVAGPMWEDRLWLAAGLGQSFANEKLPENLPESLRELVSDPKFRESVATHILGGPTPELSPPGKYDGWHMLRIKNPPPIAAENRRMQASVARSFGRFDVAIAHLRRAVELVPAHDTAHFELAAALWQAGDTEGGLAECRIAIALRPEWELPQVEIGIILINAGRHEEARTHLEEVFAKAKLPSTHLKYNLGTARWRCGAFAEGLALLEEVLADDGYVSYPYALDQAAHCAFMLGDDRRGRAWAKQAHDLGYSETYRRWASGGYRKTGKSD